MSEAAEAALPAPREPSIGDRIRDGLAAAYASPGFWPGVAIALGLTACYWTLFLSLYELWNSEDGYYSHGFLVPFISAFIIARKWDRIKDIPVKVGWTALVFLAINLIVLRAAYSADIVFLLSFSFLASLLLGTWFMAGIRWMWALAAPILYLVFALPVWTFAIDIYTNPLQKLSTQIAYAILQASGLQPMREEGSTTIYLSNFILDVGVPCSGFKLIVAITAFTVFFVLISGLKWWANLLMFAAIVPLALFINGLRVALIGMVGDRWGHDAGMSFHDYSGYITLLICFFILFRFARVLGWKN